MKYNMNGIKIYLSKLLLLFSIYSLSATPDSLLQVLQEAEYPPQAEAQLYYEIGRSYFNGMDNQNAFVYLKEGLKKAKLQDEDTLAFKCNVLLGRYQHRNQAYTKAINYFNDALKIADEQPIKDKAAVYHSMSKTYVALGNNELAFEYQYRSLELSESIQDSAGIVVALYEIGTVFFYQEHYDLALENYRKALKAAQKMNHQRFIYSCLGGIGSAYHREFALQCRKILQPRWPYSCESSGKFK